MGQVREIVTQLLASPAPTTFLDAVRIIRRARQAESADLDALMQLHDHPQTTDGAKEIIADFLKGRAQIIAHERALGERTIVLADSGKTVRGSVGQNLTLSLETRAHRGGSWETRSVTGELTWTAVGLDAERKYTYGEIHLGEAGNASIELYEVLCPPKRSTAKSQQPADDEKVFKLNVLVESD